MSLTHARVHVSALARTHTHNTNMIP